jgi:heme A synthase
MTLSRFAKYAWAVLALNVLVILWGAVVKATGSGAGCGAHWPLCNGEVVPLARPVETLIEFAHRASSGLALLGVLGLVFWAFRAYPAGHRVRRGAVASLVLIVVESLLGASLVLFGWTAFDTSLMRVVLQPIHLTNTLLLVAAILATAWWASGGAPVSVRGRGGLAAAFVAGLLGLIVVSGSGALISLGDLLYPASSLAEGLAQKFDPTAHFLVRLRLWHPGLAVGAGLYLLWLAFSVPTAVATPGARRIAWLVVGLVAAQWLAGLVNVLLLVPLWAQVIHLFLADSLWIALLLWAASALAADEKPAVAREQGAALGQVAGAD